MTVFLAGLALGILTAAPTAWVICTRWHAALRLDRDLHEQDAHKNGDALYGLERQLDRRHAALRYLARLPQARRVRVMSRWCRLLQREATW